MAGRGHPQGFPAPVRHVPGERWRSRLLSPLSDGARAGTAVITRYTHLNKLEEHYLAAVARELSPVVQVLVERVAALQL